MSGRAGGKGASASGSKGIPAGGKKSTDNAKVEAMARAARMQSRAASSAKGDGLSEAAAAQSLKPKQPQAGTATEVSPTIRSSVQARAGKRARPILSDGDDDDEIVVSGAATTSEQQGRDKLKKCAGIPVQKFKIHSSNIIIVMQLRRIHYSEINSDVARFAGCNIVAVHAPAPAPTFECSN